MGYRGRPTTLLLMKHHAAISALVASITALAALTPAARGECANLASPAIPVTELGATAGAQYHGDGLSVTPTPEGARLRCVFQKLEGQVTPKGLWLKSTAENSNGERFRVVASKAGRVTPCAPGLNASADGAHGVAHPTSALQETGVVIVADKLARFIRPGVTEEYSVSVDGVRQDFVLRQRPAGDGALRVQLDVTGAKAEALANGARLVLDGSGRKLAYTRLMVVDAESKELTARMQVATETQVVLLVDDDAATYPLRIDPTFSDADWTSLGAGTDYYVQALAVLGNDLYLGGGFTNAGGIAVNRIAKWDGSAWSALGTGVNGRVHALAVLGSDLYAGGTFTLAGGSNANYIAKWNGSVWSPLGTGMNDAVLALTVSGSDLYAGGAFTMAGGTSANGVAKWNGSVWSALGPGVSVGLPFGYDVRALAVSGSNLYVGGFFTIAGGINVNSIAKWNGTVWSNLGAGVTGGAPFQAPVRALAVSANDLYVGGAFTSAGGNSATNVAKWNGSAWSALGPGVNAAVYALAVSGNDLYAGGIFTLSDASSASRVARWDGSAWSALGSGMNTTVYALAVLGSDLYAGGQFTNAGGKPSSYVARATGPAVFTSIVPNPSPTEAILTYATAPGASLQVLSSPDLITWQTNTTVTAAGVTNSVSVNLTQPQEYFRLRRLP